MHLQLTGVVQSGARVQRPKAVLLLFVNQGTLYPVLLKLEQEGAVESDWGLCLALAVRRVAAIQLTRDGGMIAAVVALLALIGFIAALAPVRRAASIDPIQALRPERSRD